jgi:hypothetical protein
MANNTMELKYLVDYRQLQLANKEILKTGSNAQKSASAFEQAFRKVERENAKQLSDVKKKIAFSQRMEAQKAKESRETQRAAEQEAKSLERLKVKYVQGHMAMEIYTKELNDLALARKRGIITTEQQKVELERLNAATKMGTVVSAEYGNTVGQVGRRMSRTGVMTQQAGYQVGDFIVQVQSGQNAMVAFGQQATQMAGTLTMLGGKFIGIGTVLGIAIPLVTAIGAAFMRTRKDIKESSSEVETLDSRLKSLKSTLEEYKYTLQAIDQGVSLEELFATRGVEAARQRVEEAEEAVNNFVEANQAALLLSGSGIPFISGFVDDKQKEVAEELVEAQRQLQLLLEKEADTRNEIAEGYKESFEEQIALLRLQLQFGRESEAARGLERLQSERAYIADLRRQDLSQKQIDALVQQRRNTQNLADELERAEEAGTAIGGIDFSNIAQGATWAGTLADKLAQARAIAVDAAVGGNADFFDPRNETGRSGVVTRSRANPQGRSTTRQTSEGGGSSADALDSLMKRIALDEQLLGVSQERAQVMRALASSEREYSASAIEGAIKRLEAYNQEKERIAEIQGIYNTAQSSLEDGFMAMVDGTKTVEDAFKDMARSIIKELYDVLVVQQMVGSFDRASGTGSGIMGFIGNALESFDGGGYTGSGPRSGGMDGRGGYLAMLHPRETVVDHTKAGSSGGGSQRVDVRVFVDDTGNFNAKVEQISSRVVSRASPSIVKQSVGAVINQTKRGGAVKDVFR